MATTHHTATPLQLLSTKDVREKIDNDEDDESTQSIVQDEELVQPKVEKEEHRHDEHSQDKGQSTRK